MIRRHLILFSAALLPVLTTAAGFDAVTATNQLGLDLYRRLAAASPDGNLVLSPYSISSALALAYAGADGATRSEMAGVLHFPTDDAPVQASLGALRATLDVVGQSLRHDNGRPLLEWHQANRLFGQQGYDFCPSFLALMKDGYGAPFEPLDFRAKTETARDFINAWVARQTHEKIPEVVPPGGLNPRTRLVLVSALYLKAPWAEPFEKRGTRLRPFHVPGARALKMPTLQRTDFLRYAREGGFTVVALDYLGGDLQFLILLPDEGTDCHALAARLGPGDFKKWAALEEKTRSAEVELYLPKFRIDGPTQPLGAALRALGMRRAFDEPQGRADFTRIAPPRTDDYLALSEIFHRTSIAVDEEGTEAAAATGGIALAALAVQDHPRPPIVVRVDRPFLFAIQHRPSGACLFLGRIADPR